ncbi:glycosyltransferase [Rubellimicrobium rubrum]|uniref:Glycosyltransferase n=1 Tax=Rubellimicrobium rubrum TaxID=2585369 RepID=A0A5C4MQU5_9RHOB|nr:glycosyltransferase [Rubellimicrobium rubrum]TNC46439.1 glycosyltransferase [Rubellimicrobium rubrum]
MIGTYRAKLALRAARMSWLRLRAQYKVARFPLVRSKIPHGLSAPLLITLTSYPPRFPHLAETIRSLIDQTVKADGVILWIARSDEALLPKEVTELRAHGLSIQICKDIGSYKKLIPTLQDCADHYLVTADDDVYYPPRWLESLVSVARSNSDVIVGGRVHMAQRSPDGSLMPYAQWDLATIKRQAPSERHALFPTGVGGILYPPQSFDHEVFNEDNFMRLCPRGDDIWFFWMARRAGRTHMRARDWFDVIEWPSTQRVALSNDNLLKKGNDEQIRAMEVYYGTLP